MIKDEYSPYKFIHHLDRLQDLREGKQPVPLQLQIIPTNRCNNACSFCAYRTKNNLSSLNFNDRDMLSTEKIKETLDCAAEMGVKAVQATGGGEPTVHPDILEIFEYTLEKGLDLALVTNGMALTEEMCELLGKKASWVRVSVDAGDAVTYSSIRGVPESKYYKTLENIKNLVKYKEKCIIGVGYVVNKENYKGVVDAARTFRDIGVDNFRVSAVFSHEGYGYFKDFESDARKLCAEAQALSTPEYTVFNLFNDRIKDMFEGTQNYDFCPIKELQVYLGADYKLYTCCTLAYNDKGEIGSIKDQTFKELWESAAKREMYANHNPRKHCTFPCMYTNKNEFMNYCINKNARHVNFI